MSIRLRLTLLYSAILTLTLIAFGVVLYLILSSVTLNVVEGTLKDEARRIIEAGQVQFPRTVILPVTEFAAPETYVQARDLDGEVAYRTPNLRGYVLPLSDRGLPPVRHGESLTQIMSIPHGRLFVYTTPIEIGGNRVGILQVARSLREQDESLNSLRRILFTVGGIGILVAFGIGWLLAGTALRPINRIAQTAKAIGEERDFDRRVAYSGPHDEVGRLATTFNDMLVALQAAFRRAEESLQAQRRFVADASHELRTPLTTIRGNVALLQRKPPISEEDREAVLGDMVAESDRLIRLVNDLLVLARTDAGRRLNREPVWLPTLIDELCRQARLSNPGRAVLSAGSHDVTVIGDRDALKQTLLILLDNALKYSTPGGTVAVTTEADGDRAAISVRDNGEGIEPELLPHIFERFYRASTTRTGAGAGLGLAIAKVLVEAQAGTIEVKSQVGEGSVFTITLSRSTGTQNHGDSLEAVRKRPELVPRKTVRDD